MDGGGAILRNAARERLIPPAPKPPAQDLSFLGLWLRLPTSTEACWPDRAYRDTVVHRRFFGVDHYVINEPVAARHVMLDRGGTYERPIGVRRLFRPGVGRGLLLAEGDAWRAQRARLASAFTPHHVDGLLPHIRAAARDMTAGLRDGQRVNLQSTLATTAIDSLCRAMFSLLISDRAAPIAAMVKDYFGRVGRPRLTDLLARREADFAWTESDRRDWTRSWFREIDAIIATRRAQPLPGASPHDVLELLFNARDEQGACLPDAAIRDEVGSTLAAGFETTSQLLIWATYLLSRDRREQDAVRAELRRHPPASISRAADLKAWPRLAAAIHESLRLYPPVPSLLRLARAKDRVLGIEVRPGDVLIVSPWLMHRHHRYWNEPHVFMPERFAGAAGKRLRDGTYFPFGLGRRVCVGASFAMVEATLILAELLAAYDVELDDARPVMPVGVVITPNIQPWFRLHSRAGRDG